MASLHHLRECASLWDHHCLRTAHLYFFSSKAAHVVRGTWQGCLLWTSRAHRSLFCLGTPSPYPRIWPSYRQYSSRPKDLWHWIPSEIFRSHLGSSHPIFLLWLSHGRKVFSFISRKIFLNHILYLFLLYDLSSIISPPSIGSIFFNSSPEEGLICLRSAWGLKVKLRALVFMTIHEVGQEIFMKAPSSIEVIR